MNGLSIFSGNANRVLAKNICDHLNVSLTEVFVGRFSEGEIRVQIKENIRGKDVFIVQATCPPPNENLMELLILIDAARRASAKRITAVLPYYGYARQDRKDQPRVPITAKLVANLIVAAGADRVLAMDLHAAQIQGFYDIPVDHLYAINILCDYFSDKKIKNLVVVSPDVGGIKMARAYAKRLSAELAIVDKRRTSPEKTEVMHILGRVKGKTAILVDDIVATASSLMEAVGALSKKGVVNVYAAVSHGILSGNALNRIRECKALKELVITDSIPLLTYAQLMEQNRTQSIGRPACRQGRDTDYPNVPLQKSVKEAHKHSKIKVLSVAPLLAEAIKRIHTEESISCLFEETRREGV